MKQLEFELSPAASEFISKHNKYGFKTKNEMVETALQKLQGELEKKNLETSADLYSDVYKQDEDLQRLTNSASQDWPE